MLSPITKTDHMRVCVFCVFCSSHSSSKRKANGRLMKGKKNLKDLKTFRLINQRILGHVHHIDHASRMKQQYEDELELDSYCCYDDDDADQVFCLHPSPVDLRHLDSVSRQVKLSSDTAEMFGVELVEIERFERSPKLSNSGLNHQKIVQDSDTLG